MKSVESVRNCYGCGVCATVCAKSAIKVELDGEGFYAPVLDADKCNNCGLCSEVCAFLYNDLAVHNEPKASYGAWSNNPMVRNRCSSGGVGYELGKHMLSEGYKVCAVRYDASKQRAEHYIATTESELMPSVGSKYIQSYTVDGFKAIARKERYLVTGTPCQIDSFRRYIRRFRVEDNFVLMDFFCHSVPSMLAWKKYLQIVEPQTGTVVYASWRNKLFGWHDSWAIAIDGNVAGGKKSSLTDNIYTPEATHVYNSRWSEGDLFYKLFLGDYCCNPACQKSCKYKYDKSSADIRIGDFWGTTYAQNEAGVSSVVAFTEKGNEILKQLDCTFEEHPFVVVAEGQMTRNVGRARVAGLMMRTLKNTTATLQSINNLLVVDQMLCLPSRIVKKIARWVKK